MDYTEYFNNKMNEILKPFDGVPNIKNFIYSYAYEHGHSAGREEVICIAQSLAYDIKDALIKDNIINENGERIIDLS